MTRSLEMRPHNCRALSVWHSYMLPADIQVRKHFPKLWFSTEVVQKLEGWCEILLPGNALSIMNTYLHHTLTSKIMYHCEIKGMHIYTHTARRGPSFLHTFSSWIRSSICLEAASCAVNRLMVLVSCGSSMFPSLSLTTRSRSKYLAEL